MTDLYVFPAATAGRTVAGLQLAAGDHAVSGGTASFDRNLLYQIKVDNTGDAIEDKVIQITFSGTGSNQQVMVTRSGCADRSRCDEQRAAHRLAPP